jgi:hypothetical protein
MAKLCGARGLAAVSVRVGAIGWRPSQMKLVGVGAASPGKRREPVSPRPQRSARNCFTMRSSSEWKVTTTSRPPSASTRSAAASPSSNWPSSSFTAMRSA